MDPDNSDTSSHSYEKLLASLPNDEMVMFTDAVHPTCGTQPRA